MLRAFVTSFRPYSGGRWRSSPTPSTTVGFVTSAFGRKVIKVQEMTRARAGELHLRNLVAHAIRNASCVAS